MSTRLISCAYSENSSEIETATNNISKSNKSAYDTKKSSLNNEGSLNYIRRLKGIINDDGDIVDDKKIELIDGGKTVIIRFDEFVLKSSEWGNYYTSNSCTAEPNPSDANVTLPDDTVTLFYRAFYNILHDDDYSSVTTVLIDDSCNGGGHVTALKFLLTLLTGSGDVYYDDVHTGSRYHDMVIADLNLDGKVNDADTVYRQKYFGTRSTETGHECRGLNVAILSSFNSFSCGNSLPCLAHERSIKILGERSGGGSCIVGKAVTADGFPYDYSYNERLMKSDFSQTLEGGCDIDVPISCGTADAPDYSDYFDNTKLATILSGLFGTNY